MTWLVVRIRITSWPAVGLTRYIFWLFGFIATGLWLSAIPPVLVNGDFLRIIFQVVGDFFIMLGVGYSWLALWFIFLKPRKVPKSILYILGFSYLGVMSTTDYLINSQHPPIYKDGTYLLYNNNVWYPAFALGFVGIFLLGLYFLRVAFTSSSIAKFRAISWSLLMLIAGGAGVIAPFITPAMRDTGYALAAVLFIVLTLIYLAVKRKPSSPVRNS
jgi:hypothetical protein